MPVFRRQALKCAASAVQPVAAAVSRVRVGSIAIGRMAEQERVVQVEIMVQDESVTALAAPERTPRRRLEAGVKKRVLAGMSVGKVWHAAESRRHQRRR